MRTIQDVLARIRAEYLDMPGGRLTIQQVQLLCGVERMLCKTVLDSLVDAKFLCVKSDGAYARLTDEGSSSVSHEGRSQNRKTCRGGFVTQESETR